MNKNTKLAALLTLISTTVAGVVVATTKTNLMSAVFAKDCEHHGNHYAAEDGNSKEYWICCECHQRFFTEVDGTWEDAPAANADQSYRIEGLDKFTYVVEGEEITITGIDNIYDFRRNDDSGKYDITIPEGVTSIELNGEFSNKNIGKVVIPASVTDTGSGKQNLLYGTGDIDEVVYEGTKENFFSDGVFTAIIEARWSTYKDSVLNLQPYMPTTFTLEGTSYVTSSKVMGDFFDKNGKTSSGYVFYYKNEVPSRMTTSKGKTYSIDICGKDTKKLNAAFGRDNHKTFVHEGNM